MSEKQYHPRALPPGIKESASPKDIWLMEQTDVQNQKLDDVMEQSRCNNTAIEAVRSDIKRQDSRIDSVERWQEKFTVKWGMISIVLVIGLTELVHFLFEFAKNHWKVIIASILMIGFAGCATPRIKGGSTTTTASTGASAQLTQSDDPKNVSRQSSEHEVERSYSLPAGTKVTLKTSGTTNTLIGDFLLGAATLVTEHSRDKFDNSVGAAQENVVARIAATAKSMMPILITGIAFMLGAFALFYFGWYLKGAIALVLGVLCFVLYGIIPRYGGIIALSAIVFFVVVSLIILYVHYFTKGDTNQNFIPDVFERTTATRSSSAVPVPPAGEQK